MKAGDLYVLASLRQYYNWTLWSFTETQLQELKSLGAVNYTSTLEFKSDQLINHVVEIIYVDGNPENPYTANIYFPSLQLYSHIWVDCLKPLQ